MGARSLRLFIAQHKRRKIITIFIIQLMERTIAVKLIFAKNYQVRLDSVRLQRIRFPKSCYLFFSFLSTANGRNSSWRIL